MKRIDWPLISFVLLSLITFFFGLSSYGLLDNNEGLYAQIAWEMLERSDFVVPYLNGVPYIEKPPMLYWLIAGSYTLFGKSVWAARFVLALFGFLTSCSLVWFLARLGRRTEGIAAGLVLSGSLGFAIFSRMVFFDVLLTAFFTFACLSFYLWVQESSKKWLRLFYAFLACAVLTKGFLALILLGAICVSFLWIHHCSFKKIFSMLDPLGILLCVAIATPWHALASQQQEGFAWFYFINEHVLRFLDQRLPRDYYRGPFYYYLIRLPAYFVPWTFVLPFMGKRQGTPDKALRLFLWLWFGIVLAFFTVSRAKANYYMVLGMPPLALIISYVFSHAARFWFWARIVSILSAGLILVATFVAPRHESKISSKAVGLFLKDRAEPIYLFKRFEHFSSIPFYVGRPLPIVNSKSADLDFGQKSKEGKHMFLSYDDATGHNQTKFFVVHQRDEQEFSALCNRSCKKAYSGAKVSVFLQK